MPRASELKTGSIVEIKGAPHVVDRIQIQTPSARGGASLYKLRFRNLADRHKVDHSCKGDEMFKDISFQRREVQYLYKTHDEHTFMDLAEYTQFTLRVEELGDAVNYLHEDMEGIFAMIADGKVLGVEVPPVVELEIIACDPSIKGASATARTKPATLSSGLVVQIPEYLAPHETIRVDSKTAKFLGRA